MAPNTKAPQNDIFELLVIGDPATAQVYLHPSMIDVVTEQMWAEYSTTPVWEDAHVQHAPPDSIFRTRAKFDETATDVKMRLRKVSAVALFTERPYGSMEEAIEAFVAKYETQVPADKKVRRATKVDDKPRVIEEAMWVGDIYFDETVSPIFHAAAHYAYISKKKKSAVLMVGASGNGKTTLPEAFAQECKMPFYIFNVAGMTGLDIFFTAEIDDGKVRYRKNELALALEAGNCCMLFDEVSRADPTGLNVILSLLDETGQCFIGEERLTCGENVIFFASANEGAKYTGTFMMDEAFRNRFNFQIEVKNLPYDIEVDMNLRRWNHPTIVKRYNERFGCNVSETITKDNIKTVVDILTDLRKVLDVDIDLSTRTGVAIVGAIVAGLSIRMAFKNCIGNTLALRAPEAFKSYEDTLDKWLKSNTVNAFSKPTK